MRIERGPAVGILTPEEVELLQRANAPQYGPGWTRDTFTVRRDALQTLEALAQYHQRELTEELAAAIALYIEAWQNDVGAALARSAAEAQRDRQAS